MNKGFRRYMSLKRYGNTEVQGIELGTCYIFPKLDGTNASVWWDGEKLCAGSRNRQLSLEKDNAGFLQAVSSDPEIQKMVSLNPHLIFYGEWLVPHTLKTYREEAWRKFYIFDVYDRNEGRYHTYEEYKHLQDLYGIHIIDPICIFKNPDYSKLLEQLELNTFLLKDGEGMGEGVVIKNYEYSNRFGDCVFAKIVSSEFKDNNRKLFGPHVRGQELLEEDIVQEFLTKEMVDKIYAKIVNEQEGWISKYIPRLLMTAYYDLVTEELWEAVKKHKNPTINFKTLQHCVNNRVKELKKELF